MDLSRCSMKKIRELIVFTAFHECVVKMAKEISDFMDITPDWLTCQLFFVIFLKFLGIKTVAFYDRKPLK